MNTLTQDTLDNQLAELFATRMELHLLHTINIPAEQILPFKPKLKELGSDASRRAQQLIIKGPREPLEQVALELIVIENIFRKMDCIPETIRQLTGDPENLSDVLLKKLLPYVNCTESLERLNFLIQTTLIGKQLINPTAQDKN